MRMLIYISLLAGILVGCGGSSQDQDTTYLKWDSSTWDSGAVLGD